jgi:hypothetical protein
MKTLVRVTALADICLVAQSSYAAPTAFGTTDCGEWLTDSPSAKGQNKSWLLGFLSGLSVSGVVNGDPLSTISSAAQIFIWMDNYCSKNPLSNVGTVGSELYRELANKTKARK